MQISFCTKRQFIKNELSHFIKLFFKPFLFLILVISAYGVDIDVDKLLQKAKQQNKHIMFFHHIPGCPYCKTMLAENFQDDIILKEIDKNFLYVDIYIVNKGNIKFKNFKGSYKEFSAFIGAFVYPSTIFMNDNGKVIHKAIGYRNIDEYFAEITYISTKSYKSMDLESYILKLEFEKE